MVATVAFNPNITTNAQGSFQIESTGYVQGVAMDDPSARYRLAGGILADTETLPMWGGVGIFNFVTPTPAGASASLGGLVGRATQIAQGDAQLMGFSVFDQNYAMFTTPQSPVPLIGSKGQVNFYKFGSNARIAVAADPVLATLEGHAITAPVSWDFTNQRLVPFVAAYPANVFTAATRALVAGTYKLTFTTTTAHGVGVGIDIVTSGGAPAGYNGSFTTIAGTTGSTIVVDTGSAVDPGAETVLGQLNAGGGAVPCRVLDFQATGNMTVSFDPVSGFATWNRNGAAALILI